MMHDIKSSVNSTVLYTALSAGFKKKTLRRILAAPESKTIYIFKVKAAAGAGKEPTL